MSKQTRVCVDVFAEVGLLVQRDALISLIQERLIGANSFDDVLRIDIHTVQDAEERNTLPTVIDDEGVETS